MEDEHDRNTRDLWTMINNVAHAPEPLIGVLALSHRNMDRKPVTIFIIPSGEASQKVKDLLDEEFPNGPEYTELDVERN